MPLGYLFYGIICNIEERHTLQKDSRNPCKQTIPAIIFVRRTGMTKPPVQLGVGKNTLV